MTRRGKIFQFLLTTLSKCPMGLNRSLGRGLGRLFRRLPNRTREVAQTNIRRCFPELDARDRAALVRDTLNQIGCSGARPRSRR